MRTLVHNGHFKIDNVTMRAPDGDISLGDGEAMFVGSDNFAKHIANMETMPNFKKVILVSALSVLIASPGGYETTTITITTSFIPSLQ